MTEVFFIFEMTKKKTKIRRVISQWTITQWIIGSFKYNL